MKQILIEVGDSELVLTVKAKGITNDAEFLGLILEAYATEAKNLIRIHNCGNKDCHFVKVHTALMQDMERIANLHEQEHYHG